MRDKTTEEIRADMDRHRAKDAAEVAAAGREAAEAEKVARERKHAEVLKEYLSGRLY